MNKLIAYLRNLLQQPIIRYFIMSAAIVGFELITFAVMNSWLHISYLIATPTSMAISFILNWYLGRKFVFNNSKFRVRTEFTLVFITSLVGVGIQLAVISVCVELLHLIPLLGKFIAIVVTFFWNFLIRKKYIFPSQPKKTAKLE